MIYSLLDKLHYLLICLVLISPISILSAQSALYRPIKLNDIVYHPGKDRIYAAAPGELKDGNSIYIIHPNTGLIEGNIPVGSEPTVLRFSDNFQYLYIGYLGLNELHRYDLLNEKLEIIAVLNSGSKPLYVTEILPIPGQPEKVVVGLRVLNLTPETFKLAVFDGFKELPMNVPSSSQKMSRKLVLDPQTNRIFGFGHAYRTNGLIEYELTETGISVKNIYEDILNGNLGKIEIHNGKLYSQVGQVLDLTQDPPTHIFDNQNQDPIKSVVLDVDPSSSLIYTIDANFEFVVYPILNEASGYYFCTIDPTDYHVINKKQLKGFDFAPKKLIYTGVPGRFAAISEYLLVKDFPTRAQLIILGACQEEAAPERLTIIPDKEEYCWLDTATFTVSGNYAKYNWSTGDVEKTIQIPIESYGTRKISVAVSEENGCIIAQSDSIDIQFNIPPTDHIWITGNQLLCPKDSVLLTINENEPSSNGYLWSTGETTKTIYVTKPGTYSAYRVSGPDCYTVDPACFTVIHHPDRELPKAKIEALGDTEFCSNDYLRLRALDEQDYYVWNGNIGQDQEMSVLTTGFQTLQYADENGCLGEADSIWTTVLPSPPKAIIRNNINQYLLFDYTSYEKKWFYNGESLPIDTDTLIAIKRGYYHLGLIGTNGCLSELSIERRVSTPFFEEGTVGVIKGKVWLDTNQNGRLDSLDKPFPNARIKLDVDNQVTFTNGAGLFRLVIPRQDYSVQTRLDPTLWKTVIGEEGYNDDFSEVVSPFYTFLVQSVLTEPRLSTEIHTGIVRCNQKVPVWTTVRNEGTSFSGELCLKVNPKITTGNFQGDSISIPNGRFCWTLDSIRFGESQNNFLSLDLPGVDAIGEIFQFDFSVEKENEEIVGDFYEDVFRCAYDPNDKQVAPRRGPDGQYALFEDELEYTIRFQNTGNDTAFTVLLKDELSTDLDWNSFSPVAASHDYEVNLNATNGHLEIQFDNILLPDSTTNVLGSQGFFSYKILPNEDLAEETLIENKAGIFFDLNPAIITNTVTSNMVSEIPVATSTAEIIKKVTFLFAPNPHQKNITLFTNGLNRDVKLIIYDMLGKEVYTSNVSNTTSQWSINTLKWGSGTYFYQISETDGTTLLDTGKLVKF